MRQFTIHRHIGGWWIVGVVLKMPGSVPHFKKHVDFVKIGPGSPQSDRINLSTLQLVVYKFETSNEFYGIISGKINWCLRGIFTKLDCYLTVISYF